MVGSVRVVNLQHKIYDFILFFFKLLADTYHQILNLENILLLTNFQGTVKCIEILFLHIKITEIQICTFPVM